MNIMAIIFVKHIFYEIGKDLRFCRILLFWAHNSLLACNWPYFSFLGKCISWDELGVDACSLIIIAATNHNENSLRALLWEL